ncbi:MAG TPA: amino acid adenylation domain-containing protein, partial [Candidatus Kapabacteria bacterium]|nr:amino acid adenylation domain-containing protein [Candidatus Kapabacteria bacterium]
MKTREDELVIFNAAEDYWLQKLKGVTLNPVFGDREYLDKSLTKTFNRWHETFPIQLIQRLQVVSKDSDTNVFLIFLAAINILMYKYTGMTDILIGTPGFPDEEEEDKEEAKVNDVLLFYRTDVEEHHIPRDMINESLNELNDAYENHRFDYESFFKRFCNNKNGESEALSALGLQYNKINRESRYIETCDLLFKIEKNDSQIDFSIQYRSGIYREEQVAQLGRHFLNVLTAMIENLDQTVQTISLLTSTEQQKLAGDFAGKEVVYQTGEEIFLPIFERQAAITPKNQALAYENNILSYRELNEHANRLARLLLNEAFLETDSLVPILMERSDKMVISIIAVWKCGAAYLPIDPSYPADRIETIIKDSSATIIISETGMIPPGLEKTLASFTKILYLDQVKETLMAEDHSNLCTIVHPGDLAYVIYTSGSTGKPKGVMIEQRGMMNHLHAKLDELNIDSGSVIAQNASHCFDISIWQFFAALLRGGKTIVYANKVVLSPEIFIKQLGEQGVNILEVVPSYLAMMLDLMVTPQLSGRFPALNYLLVTGESLKPGLVKRWFEKFPDIKMVNAYGPTEASDDITHFHITASNCDFGTGQNSIPIGRTLRNFRIYIVDAGMDLCPPGVKGEIYVSGIGVGRGYLNISELTSEKFILLSATGNPFEKWFSGPSQNFCLIKNFSGGQRGRFFKKAPLLYHTGDIGRYLPDGNIEFFGRKDYQVKVRGFRIELEEIENKLSLIPGIHNAVVIDREDKAGNTYLCA